MLAKDERSAKVMVVSKVVMKVRESVDLTVPLMAVLKAGMLDLGSVDLTVPCMAV